MLWLLWKVDFFPRHTFFCLISVAHLLEIHDAITFYQHYLVYQLCYIIFFSMHTYCLCYLDEKRYSQQNVVAMRSFYYNRMSKGYASPLGWDHHPQKPQGVEKSIIGCITRLLTRPLRLHQWTTTYHRIPVPFYNQILATLQGWFGQVFL